MQQGRDAFAGLRGEPTLGQIGPDPVAVSASAEALTWDQDQRSEHQGDAGGLHVDTSAHGLQCSLAGEPSGRIIPLALP